VRQRTLVFCGLLTVGEIETATILARCARVTSSPSHGELTLRSGIVGFALSLMENAKREPTVTLKSLLRAARHAVLDVSEAPLATPPSEGRWASRRRELMAIHCQNRGKRWSTVRYLVPFSC
jgi:hypothetical protein